MRIEAKARRPHSGSRAGLGCVARICFRARLKVHGDLHFPGVNRRLVARAKKLGHAWEIIYSDLLGYATEQKYDAIVIMGVIEHLPQYGRVVRKFEALLKPGGRVFLDGSACTQKYQLSSSAMTGRATLSMRRTSTTQHHFSAAPRRCFEPPSTAVRDEANPGIDAAFSDPVITRYRDRNSNLRTQLERIIGKAGLTAWPKLFQNLRSTRETELAERFPMHVVCEWIGNSQAVAAKHYLQTTDEHYAAACTLPADNLQKPVQSDAETARSAPQPKNEPLTISESCEGLRYFAPCQVGDAGLEPATSAL